MLNVSCVPWNWLAIHLVGKDNVTKRVDGLVKGEGATVLVTNLVLVIAQEPDPESLLRGVNLANADAVHVHARRSDEFEIESCKQTINFIHLGAKRLKPIKSNII